MSVALAILGASWLLVELLFWGFPHLIEQSARGPLIVAVLVIALLCALAVAIPPVRFVKSFKSRSIRIELGIGDLLDPKHSDNLAILSGEYFDSCFKTAIAPGSIKGQLINSYFGQDSAEFDRAVDASLTAQGITGTENPSKKRGTMRMTQYPIGTTASVSLGNRRAFIVAGAHFDDATSRTTTSPSGLWTSLLAVWRAAATHGQRKPLAIGIWGSNLGNAPGNRLVLYQTLLCSLAAYCASNNQPPTTTLRILTWPGDYSGSEFREMIEVLNSFEL